MAAIVAHPTDELNDRQLALFYLARAEATSIDERLMLVPMLAKQIRASALDALTVREALLADAGHTAEAGS